MAGQFPVPKTVAVAQFAVPGRDGGIPARRYRHRDSSISRPLLWLHGGAFSGGGLDQRECHAVAAALAAAGREVVTIDYRRVPGWNPLRDPPPGRLGGVRYPVPLNDVTDAVAWLQSEQGDQRMYLGGASAGACLAAAATLWARDEGASVPAGLVLAYGTFHAALPPLSPALAARVRGVHGILQFRPETVRRMNYNYAGSMEAMSDPHAFPGGADLRRLPPVLLVDADRDTLRASGAAYARELVTAGVRVTYAVLKGSRHGFLDRPRHPAFAVGIARIVRWLNESEAAL